MRSGSGKYINLLPCDDLAKICTSYWILFSFAVYRVISPVNTFHRIGRYFPLNTINRIIPRFSFDTIGVKTTDTPMFYGKNILLLFLYPNETFLRSP